MVCAVTPSATARPDAACSAQRPAKSGLNGLVGTTRSSSYTARAPTWAAAAGPGPPGGAAAPAPPGVVVVPGPMGGGAGYIYAAMSAVQDARGLSEDDLLRGLFVAAGIGAISYTRSAPTGEVTGCTGEAGTCGAMAAAAITEMVGGSPEQGENAASPVQPVT